MSRRRRISFGRLKAQDARDMRYPMSAVLPKRIPVATKHYRTGPVLDQGAHPACVGYSWRQWLSSEPLMTKTGLAALGIYHKAQTLDEWPGEGYDGTSVRGGVKAILEHVANYVWAFSAAPVRDFMLAGKGCVVLGTEWRTGMMDTDSKGYLNLTGASEGGHAYLLCGYSGDRKAFRVINSWGRAWGQSGRAWLRFDDADHLIRAEGEACAAVEQKLAPVAV